MNIFPNSFRYLHGHIYSVITTISPIELTYCLNQQIICMVTQGTKADVFFTMVRTTNILYPGFIPLIISFPGDVKVAVKSKVLLLGSVTLSWVSVLIQVTKQPYLRFTPDICIITCLRISLFKLSSYD